MFYSERAMIDRLRGAALACEAARREAMGVVAELQGEGRHDTAHSLADCAGHAADRGQAAADLAAMIEDGIDDSEDGNHAQVLGMAERAALHAFRFIANVSRE